MALPDDVWVEWAPTNGINATATATWTKIVAPLKMVSYRRGIRRAAQRADAGEATIVFDNKSRFLDPMNRQSPLWPNLTTRRPIRVMARHRGTTIRLWTGYISGITPTWSLNAAEATITAVDRKANHADVNAPTSAFRWQVKALTPRWWWPLDEAGGSTAYNLGADPLNATHTLVNLRGEPLLPYGTEPSAGYGETGASGTDLANGYSRIVPPFTFAFIAMVAENPPAITVPFSQGGTSANAPEGDLGFRVGTDGLCNFGVTDAGGTDYVKAGGIDSGSPRLVVARYSPGTINIRVDNVQYNGTSTAGRQPRLGPVRIGNSVNKDKPFKGRLSHVIVWDRYITDANLTALWNAYNAPRVEAADTRIHWLLDQAGEPTAGRNMELSLEPLGPYRGGGSVADAIDRAANTDGGLFIMDGEGRPTFFARYHQGRVGGTYNTKPEGTTDYGLRELGIDMDEAGFFTVASPQVSAPSPVTIPFRHGNADHYGDLPWSPDTEYFDPAYALAGARRAVGAATPRPHLTGAEHYATPESMVDALITGVWDTVTVVANPPDDAGPGPFVEWGPTNMIPEASSTFPNGGVGGWVGVTNSTLYEAGPSGGVLTVIPPAAGASRTDYQITGGLVAGTNYTWSGFVSSTTGEYVSLEIVWFDAASNFLGTNSRFEAGLTNDPRAFSFDSIAPPKAAFVQLRMTIDAAGANTDNLAIRAMRFTPATMPTANILPARNSTFPVGSGVGDWYTVYAGATLGPFPDAAAIVLQNNGASGPAAAQIGPIGNIVGGASYRVAMDLTGYTSPDANPYDVAVFWFDAANRQISVPVVAAGSIPAGGAVVGVNATLVAPPNATQFYLRVTIDPPNANGSLTLQKIRMEGPAGFWGSGLGWGGPGPIRQTSRILSEEVTFDFIGKTTTKTMDLEPARSVSDMLTLDESTFQDAVGDWGNKANSSGMNRTTAFAITGTHSGYFYSAAAGDFAVHIQKPNKRYHGLMAEAWLKPVYTSTPVRKVRLDLTFHNAAGTQIGGVIYGQEVQEVSGEKVRAFVSFVGGDNGDSQYVRLSVTVLGAVAFGEEHLIDDVHLWFTDQEVR